MHYHNGSKCIHFYGIYKYLNKMNTEKVSGTNYDNIKIVLHIL